MEIRTGKLELRTAHICFAAVMTLLWPVRLFGILGTKSRPIYFEAGQTIPFWLELSWPRVPVVFGTPVKSWFSYKTGQMFVQSLEPDRYIVEIEAVADIHGLLLVGAPTCLIGFNGERKPSPSQDIALQRS